MIRILLFVVCLIFANDLALARQWKNLEGKVIEADFVRLEGEVVVLSLQQKEYEVLLPSLSLEDQEFVSSQMAVASSKASELEAKAVSSVSFPLPFTTWISGDPIDESTVAGRPVVAHAWQAHCGRCPSHLEEFEKFARRKRKSGAIFMIWHNYDKTSLAQSKSEELGLKLPIYHGKPVKWDEKKFGKRVWPYVTLIDSTGNVIYMGVADRKFEKALKAVTEEG